MLESWGDVKTKGNQRDKLIRDPFASCLFLGRHTPIGFGTATTERESCKQTIMRGHTQQRCALYYRHMQRRCSRRTGRLISQEPWLAANTVHKFAKAARELLRTCMRVPSILTRKSVIIAKKYRLTVQTQALMLWMAKTAVWEQKQWQLQDKDAALNRLTRPILA